MNTEAVHIATHIATDVADEHLDAVLAALAGPDAVAREDQRQAVRALVTDRKRVLVVQATGWGKSAVYWAATSALRASGGGLTLVVSPLLALMRDQASAAERAGLVAATINSTNFDEWDDVLARVEAGTLDVLLVSPERLGNPRFEARLPRLLANTGMVVIDEAHCISDWGFDFRPDYQRLTRHLLSLAPGTPVLATTATANARVTADVADQLGADTVTFRGSLARTSLRLAVVPGLTALDRWAWVADALGRLEGSGIVYTLTVAEADRVANFLTSAGFEVAAYSGRLDAASRIDIEDRLRRNELKAVVATSALGMGYDKPDLAFCIHVGSPASPVAYYQQVGRAGRALDTALAVLLPAENDERIWEYFAGASVPDPALVEQSLAVLADGPASLPTLESVTGIRRNRLEGMLKLLAAEGVVAKEGTGWRSTGEAYVHDTAKWEALAATRRAEADLMRHYAAGDGCLMQFLQQALDDPDPQPCGRCSVCTGVLPEPGLHPSAELTASVRTFARGADALIEPRKLWPSGIEWWTGRIVGCVDGRALAFADDPGWATELLRFERGDAPIEQAIADGLVAVLGRWRNTWVQRPVAIVPMPSARHPQRVASIAEHIAAVGKLPIISALTQHGPPPAADTASGARVRALLDRLSVVEGVELPDGPLLLVDDTYRSGWTMTVAAAMLRRAGATSVLPLVVHQLP
ncbi:MAG: ATP-dependent helicase, RecQ family [Ilumatobacteraceae bacterium]|nr:ATP-dependent helicase, RecQ family [Ilumatobacteraceae bacterium]